MATSTAYPHDPPRELMPDVLFVHGRMRMGPGMYINRNMIVVRNGRELTLINPIRLTSEGEKALEQYGDVRHAIRLGPFHGVDDAHTATRFGARFSCAGTDGDYDVPEPSNVLSEGGELPFPDGRVFLFREAARPEGCILLERNGGLLISCDSIQHWESTSNCSLLAKGVSHAMGFVHPANIGPPWKKMMTKKGGSLRPDFDRLLDLPFDNLVGAHGQPLMGGAREALSKTVDRVFG